ITGTSGTWVAALIQVLSPTPTTRTPGMRARAPAMRRNCPGKLGWTKSTSNAFLQFLLEPERLRHRPRNETLVSPRRCRPGLPINQPHHVDRVAAKRRPQVLGLPRAPK